MSTFEHEWPEGDELTRCCTRCGTPYGLHATKAQPCVPRWSEPEKLRPEPARRTYAFEDFDTISARREEIRKAEDHASFGGGEDIAK